MVNGNAQRYATIMKHSEKFLIVIQLQLCISVFVQTGFSGSVDKIKNEYWLLVTVIRQGCQCRLFILLVLKRNFKFFGYFFYQLSLLLRLDYSVLSKNFCEPLFYTVNRGMILHTGFIHPALKYVCFHYLVLLFALYSFLR